MSEDIKEELITHLKSIIGQIENDNLKEITFDSETLMSSVSWDMSGRIKPTMIEGYKNTLTYITM